MYARSIPGDTGFHNLSVTFKPPCVRRHRPKTVTARISNLAPRRPFSLHTGSRETVVRFV